MFEYKQIVSCESCIILQFELSNIFSSVVGNRRRRCKYITKEIATCLEAFVTRENYIDYSDADNAVRQPSKISQRKMMIQALVQLSANLNLPKVKTTETLVIVKRRNAIKITKSTDDEWAKNTERKLHNICRHVQQANGFNATI